MLDNQFDHIINQKLREANLDIPKSDWNVFSQKLKVALENATLEDQLFDEAINSKLNNASLDIPRPEWGALAAKLNTNNLVDSADQDFDQIIKDKVSDVQINMPKANWSDLAQKIADANFDASIKSKIENSAIDIPEADWPIFASILAASYTESSTTLNDAEFDAVIQQKIDDSNFEIPNSNWNALSEKLQSAGISDQQMDAEVKSRLENYSTRYQDSHWAILREKMIKTQYLRRNLYSIKLFEAALAILLFMTFANFVADHLKTDLDDTENIFAHVEVAESASNNDKVENAKPSLNNNDEKSINTPLLNTFSKNNVSTEANLKEQYFVSSGNNDTPNNNDQESRNSSSEVNTVLIAKVEEREESSNEITAQLNSFEKDDHKDNIKAVDNLNLSKLEEINFNLNTPTRKPLSPSFEPSIITKVETEKKESNGLNIYLGIGQNTHEIYTPMDELVFHEAYSRKSKNLEFDLKVGKEFDQIELMAGLSYQRISYDSWLVEELEIDEEIHQFSINSIRFDLLKIPANLRWNYRINNNIVFFADIGLSANLMMKTDYDIFKQLKLEDPDTETQPKPISFPPDSTDEDLGFGDTAHATKNYQRGLAQGATFNESIIGNLDSGIGVKYKLSKTIQSYARVSMSQQLGELRIGPNNDSYSTWGLQLGLLYSLK